MEMLIVIAIVAVLISVAVPVLSSQLERSRETVDLANVRSAYAQVSTEALLGNTGVPVTVNLKQKQAGWQSANPVNIGGIVHSKSVGDTDNWHARSLTIPVNCLGSTLVRSIFLCFLRAAIET